MALSATDIKKLWGRAGGRCSASDCGRDCVPFLNLNEPTVIGEMAHVVPQSTRGPRGTAERGEDIYENTTATVLIENKAIWEEWGPESYSAKQNPISNAALVWQLRKADGIIPRNARIVRLIESHANFFSPKEYEICCRFAQHAQAFEQSTHSKLDVDAQSRFPCEFQELIERYV
jgi:hypothetical protein